MTDIQTKLQKLQAQMAKLNAEIAIIEAGNPIIEAVTNAITSVEKSEAVLSKNYLIAFARNGGIEVQLNPITASFKYFKTKTNGTATGNGTGNGNFAGNPVSISQEVADKYSLEELSYASIRKLALAMGISVEDKHPGQTLKQTYPDLYDAMVKVEAPAAEVAEPAVEPAVEQEPEQEE